MRLISSFLFLTLVVTAAISQTIGPPVGGGSPGSIPTGTPITGCAGNLRIFYNSSNTFACAAGVTTNGTALLAADGTTTLPTYTFTSAPDMGFMKTGASVYYAQGNGLRVRFSSSGTWVGATSQLGWASTASVGSTVDTAMARNAAGVVEVNNGTNGNFGDMRLRVMTTSGFTVGALPAGTIGMRAYVTDQLTTCAVTGAVLTGGGAVVCPVFYNGTAWVGG